MATPTPSGFDKLAGAYRWMEYLSFGPLLQQCRVHMLPRVGNAKHALLLGDGDGRFCAALLRASPEVQVTAVDGSARMLQVLCTRAERDGNAGRVTALQADVTAMLPGGAFDLVCTHFLLDCLSDNAVMALAANVRQRHAMGGHWVISEFGVPRGARGWPAAAVVRALYLAFSVLTGLRTRRLPDHAGALQQSGFRLQATHTRLAGLLRSELWQVVDTPSGQHGASSHASHAQEIHHAECTFHTRE